MAAGRIAVRSCSDRWPEPRILMASPPPDRRPRIGSMCTGYGGLDLAAQAVYGGQLTWGAEKEPYATVLLHRRFPGVPNVGDLTAIDWTQVPAVDVVTAGFPCQDI